MTPRVLFPGDLPLAELAAARLDGEVFRIGLGYGAMDELDDTALRAASLAPLLGDRVIAEGRTAAWLWGAVEREPEPVEVCVPARERVRPHSPVPLRVREVVLSPADVVRLAGVAVTTPLRTAMDLVRLPPDFGPTERAAVRALRERGGWEPGELVAALARRHRVPHVARALARAQELDAP